MSKSDIETLVHAIKTHWPNAPGEKARRYIGQFFNTTRLGTKIAGQVVGNHGSYTVSIQSDEQRVSSACSCYIGKHGYCHHCHALALTFLDDPQVFVELKTRPLHAVQQLSDLEEYLRGVTLESLLDELRAKGTTQKAFAEAIGMNSRHLSSVKSSERRNRHYNLRFIVPTHDAGLTGVQGGQKMLPFSKCPVCGGEVVEKEVEKLLRGGVHTAVVTVRAEVCLHCGERLYAKETISLFEQIRASWRGKKWRTFNPWGNHSKSSFSISAGAA